jgi:hypothetical protein
MGRRRKHINSFRDEFGGRALRLNLAWAKFTGDDVLTDMHRDEPGVGQGRDPVIDSKSFRTWKSSSEPQFDVGSALVSRCGDQLTDVPGPEMRR